MVRQLRWPEQVECPHCHAIQIAKNGHDETQPDCQRYVCRMCNRAFDNLTGPGFDDMQRRVPYIERVQTLIGWRPEYDLDDIIRQVIDDRRLPHQS
jgi:rubredoxin